MRQTWRWFGPHDLTSVDDMRQAGVEGVVSALHHVPTGAVWTNEEITKRQAALAPHLAWEVVESLPVPEDIKKQKGNWRTHISNYKTSLENLADKGLETICYNSCRCWTGRAPILHIACPMAAPACGST